MGGGGLLKPPPPLSPSLCAVPVHMYTFYKSDLKHHRLTNNIHLTLKMDSVPVVKTSVNSYFQNYLHRSIDFSFNSNCSQIVSYLCQKCKKKNRGYLLYFRDKARGKLPYFEKLLILKNWRA